MLKNGFFNTVGTIAKLGLSIATIPLLIGLLGIEKYGLWVLVSSTAGMLVLVEAGLSHATTVFLSQDLIENDPKGIAETLTITIGSMLLLITIAIFILWTSASVIFRTFQLGEDQYAIAISCFRLGSIVVGQRLLQQVTVAVIQAYQRYGILNILTVVQSIITNIGLVVVAWLGGNILQMMWWQLISTFIILISHGIIAFALLRQLYLQISWNLPKFRAIARFSVMTWLGALGGLLFAQLDRVIVGALLGTSMLGIYAAITNITKQINTLSSVPVQPLLPVLSAALVIKQNNYSQVEYNVKQSFQLNTLVAFGMGGVLSILAPLVMQVMLPGIVSKEQIIMFQIATLIYTAYSVNAVGYYILFSVKAVKTFMLIQLGSGLLSISMIAFGAKYYGLWGAIIGNSGFLGVWLFTVYGMDWLHIKPLKWIKWILSPILVGLLTMAISIGIEANIIIRLLASTIFSVILLIWFIWEQRKSPLMARAAWLTKL